MKKTLTFFSLISLSFLTKAQSYEWAKGISGNGTSDMGIDIAIDAQKNVYTTGYFTNTADFNPGSGTNNLSSAGAEDIFIQKLDSMGNYVWAVRIGGTGTDIGRAISISTTGEVFVAGQFANQVDMNPGTATNNFGGSGTGTNGFLLRLDAAGNYIGCMALAGSANECILNMAMDAGNGIFVTGYFMGTTDFDPTSGFTNYTATGGTEDIFIAKYNNALGLSNVVVAGSGNTDIGHALTVDANGNVLVTGEYRGTVDFDPVASGATLTCLSQQDVFVAKYDNGLTNVSWAKSFSGLSNEKGYAIVCDPAGNSYITGEFGGKVDFNPSTLPADTLYFTSGPFANADGFLVKLDVAGSFVWAGQMAHISNSGGTYGRALAIDEYNHVYVSGDYEGVSDFTFTPDTTGPNWNGGRDMYIAKYDSNGVYQWAFGIGTNLNDMGRGLLYNDRSLFVTGYYTTSVDFNPSPLQTNVMTGNGSTNDIYVARYSANCLYPTSPTMTTSSYVYCAGSGDSLMLTASGGTLNDASGWGWYENSCTGNFLGTGDTIMVAPTGTVSYYLHATGCPRLEYILCQGLTTSEINLNATATATGNALSANTVMGATYQWLNCDSAYSAISGATTSTYTATVDGNYAVQMNYFGCVDTSSCVNVSTTGIENAIITHNTISVLPNPAQEQISIQTREPAFVLIYNAVGELITSRQINKTELLDISIWPNGIYFVRLQNSTAVAKLIKQ